MDQVPASPIRQSIPAMSRTLRIPVDLDRRVKMAKAELEMNTGQSISINSFIVMLMNEGLENLKNGSGRS